jgi:hypothetical protein
MSNIHELTSVVVRIPETLRRRKTKPLSSLQEVQLPAKVDEDASAEARKSFISQCTRQSLQVWRQRAPFGRDESAAADRVHSSLRQEEGNANESADHHGGFALVGDGTAHSR